MDSSQGGDAGAVLQGLLLPERYRLLHQLAVGGMGSVWVAADQILGRRVAVKVLAEQLASQPIFVKRFEREARTAAALSSHPNVVTIYDVGEREGRPFIVMEFLSGGTVYDRLHAGRVTPTEVVRWLGQAASALDFAHGRGVVHRDVKPRNLLFDSEDRLKIADLGIARAAYEDSLTASGELLGTASYISPEQAAGEPATPASDRYSLAVVAYELLTGSRPFRGQSLAEQALQQVESEPEPPSRRAPALTEGVDEVVLKGLATDPQERWETGDAFVAALAEAFAASRVRKRFPAKADEAPQPPDPTRPLIDPKRTWPHAPAPEPRRFPARTAGIVATLLAAVAIAGIALTSTGGDGGSVPIKKRERAEGPSRAKERGRDRPRTPAPAPATPPPATATPATGSATALNNQGFRLMKAGRYDEAIPLLQRAVAASAAGSADLTQAYALYNLGRSLRLAGRPDEAIPYLERRMRFANQREVVRRELAAARAAAE